MSEDLPSWCRLILDPVCAPHRRISIEASAGTGKTWTIASIYLRMVVEYGLRPRSIVVSTFTDAATAELRDRIRKRLLWALQFDPDRSDDSESQELRDWLCEVRKRLPLAELHWRLRAALAEFERAPIGTLHALCRRILVEQAMATGGALRLGELVPDEIIRAELLADLTRWLAHSAIDDEAAGLLALQRMSLYARAKLLTAAMRPGLHLVGGEVEELSALFADRNWPARLRQLAKALPLRPRRTALRTRLVELADWLESGDLAAAVPNQLSELIAEQTWRDQLAPGRVETILTDPITRFARRAAATLNEREAILRARGVRTVLPMLARWRASRLAAREQLTFDELIERVHAEITRPRLDSDHLADRLHRQWPVTLIDEFQDTDARQWAIFDVMHRDRDGSPRGLMLLIGDPKQAIYGFRGGNLSTYQRAVATATQSISLDINQRASKALVDALDALYRNSPDPFAGSGIRYTPVRSAGRADQTPLLRSDGTARAGLSLHRVGSNEFALCAALIADYLAPGRWRIGDRPLTAGDIAVLLPRHDDIETLREVLRRHEIPCASGSRSDVFASPWAEELRVVLHALFKPNDAGALRAALATRLLGVSYGELHRLVSDEAAWRAQIERVLHWNETWQRHGVLAAIEAILAHAAPHLLARHDGERALTDLRHLGELLQAEASRHPGRHRLLAWFAARCESATEVGQSGMGEHELRIESDSGRVQLLTLHASKGLEFSIVLLARFEAERGPRIDYPIWTDRKSGQRCLDLGSSDLALHRALAEEEALQERTRLLYVALTRAKYACHLILPEAQFAAGDWSSALGRLIRDQDSTTSERSFIRVEPNPPDPASSAPPPTPTPRRARTWPSPRPLELIHSFSSSKTRVKATWIEDQAADDETSSFLDAESPAIDPRLAELDDWRGKEFGNLLHAIFERRDRSRPIAMQRSLIEAEIDRAGLRVEAARRDRLVTAVIDRVQATLRTDLGGGLRLEALDARAERAEMDFQIRLERLDLAALRRLCETAGEIGLLPETLGDAQLRGFLSGRIDSLVLHDGAVHVLDYKSNRLGPGLGDYQGEALHRAMSEHGYRWQALIYAIATRRYLANRQRGLANPVPYGDAIFLFVRAVGLAPGAGIWRHRFDPSFLAEVDALFAAQDFEGP